MRKLIVLIAVVFTAFSCEEDVRFNNPSFQALKNDVFWRAIDSRATIAADGSLLIEAFTSNEILSIKTTGSAKDFEYLLGGGNSQNVVYSLKEKAQVTIYRTDGTTANGRITVTEYDEINKTISGTFTFNIKNSDESDIISPIISFREGVFYKVPVSSQIL